MRVSAREALERRETPYGSVGVVHSGAGLQAWWIWKDDEAIDLGQLAYAQLDEQERSAWWVALPDFIPPPEQWHVWRIVDLADVAVLLGVATRSGTMTNNCPNACSL